MNFGVSQFLRHNNEGTYFCVRIYCGREVFCSKCGIPMLLTALSFLHFACPGLERKLQSNTKQIQHRKFAEKQKLGRKLKTNKSSSPPLRSMSENKRRRIQNWGWLTSVAASSSSLYPRINNISCTSARSKLEQASPRGDNNVCFCWVFSYGTPIKTYDGTSYKPLDWYSICSRSKSTSQNESNFQIPQFVVEEEQEHSQRDLKYGLSRGSYCKHCEAECTSSVPSSFDKWPSEHESITIRKFCRVWVQVACRKKIRNYLRHFALLQTGLIKTELLDVTQSDSLLGAQVTRSIRRKGKITWLGGICLSLNRSSNRVPKL